MRNKKPKFKTNPGSKPRLCPAVNRINPAGPSLLLYPPCNDPSPTQPNTPPFLVRRSEPITALSFAKSAKNAPLFCNPTKLLPNSKNNYPKLLPNGKSQRIFVEATGAMMLPGIINQPLKSNNHDFTSKNNSP